MSYDIPKYLELLTHQRQQNVIAKLFQEKNRWTISYIEIVSCRHPIIDW